MHISKPNISSELLLRFARMIDEGSVTEDDVKAFLDNPSRWHLVPSLQGCESRNVLPTSAVVNEAEITAQAFWQGVYDELGLNVTVPNGPILTDKQRLSFVQFGFMLVYIPEITEADYPSNFIKSGIDECFLKSRMPLQNRWAAVETIEKLNKEDPEWRSGDRLMTAIGQETRRGSSYNEAFKLLQSIAKVTEFPFDRTRLPSVEEWNLVGNLFNWLRAHRSMSLPDLGETHSWEWCMNTNTSTDRYLIGERDRYAPDSGLGHITHRYRGYKSGKCSFRVFVAF